MELVARKTASYGVWGKTWDLFEVGSPTPLGCLHMNTNWDKIYSAGIYSPLGPEFGLMLCADFDDRAEALAWARKNIENHPQHSYSELQELYNELQEGLRDELRSNDWAAVDGTANRIETKINKVRRRLWEMEES